MKSLKYVVICLCAVLSLGFCVNANEFVNVDVSELYADENQQITVVISNYDELCSFRDAVNRGEMIGANAVLEADITLVGEWTPIGNGAYPFNGNFDGQGHKISGLNITDSVLYAGFFGNVCNGIIENFWLVSPVIDIKVANDTQNVVAGFVTGNIGCNSSKTSVTIENVKVSDGNAYVKASNYSSYCAGISGFCESDGYATVYIKNCSVENADLTSYSSQKSAFVGLVTGAFYSRSATDSSISSCVVDGSCKANAPLSSVGGLIVGTGFANGYWASAPSSLAAEDSVIIVDNCIASGSVITDAKVNSYAGSITGSLSAAAVVGNSYYTNDVTLTAIKGSAVGEARFKGIKVEESKLYDESYVKNTVKLDTVDVWKVNSDTLPSLYTFEESCFAIDVTAGTRLYYADGSYRDFDKDITTYIDLSKDGTYYTLSGYDKQRVWSVFEGNALEIAELENALSTKAQSQVRTREPSGMRFSSSITDSAKYMSGMLDLVEYGYIVTAENSVTGLVDGAYDLDFSLVDSGKAKQGVAYSTKDNTDVVFERDAVNEKTVFAGVMYNIPLTKSGVTTVIAARPYYKTGDGKIVLGAVYKATLYDTALKIKNENSESYTQNKEYIDSIIGLVQE